PAHRYPAAGQRQAQDIVELGQDQELEGRRLVALATYRGGLARFADSVALNKAAGRLATALHWPDALPSPAGAPSLPVRWVAAARRPARHARRRAALLPWPGPRRGGSTGGRAPPFRGGAAVPWHERRVAAAARPSLGARRRLPRRRRRSGTPGRTRARCLRRRRAPRDVSSSRRTDGRRARAARPLARRRPNEQPPSL